MLYIGPYREKPLKICLFETRRPMPLIFGAQLCLVDLCQDCSSYSPGAKNGPAQWPTCFTWIYIGKTEKSFCLKQEGLAL